MTKSTESRIQSFIARHPPALAAAALVCILLGATALIADLSASPSRPMSDGTIEFFGVVLLVMGVLALALAVLRMLGSRRG